MKTLPLFSTTITKAKHQMADLDSSVYEMLENLSDLKHRVEQGNILSPEDAQSILHIRRELALIQSIDARNEAVMKHKNLKAITDKWQ